MNIAVFGARSILSCFASEYLFSYGCLSVCLDVCLCLPAYGSLPLPTLGSWTLDVAPTGLGHAILFVQDLPFVTDSSSHFVDEFVSADSGKSARTTKVLTYLPMQSSLRFTTSACGYRFVSIQAMTEVNDVGQNPYSSINEAGARTQVL